MIAKRCDFSILKVEEFCGERAPLEDRDVQERFEKELLLSIWDRPQVILWLKRSRRYLPYIEKMFRENYGVFNGSWFIPLPWPQ